MPSLFSPINRENQILIVDTIKWVGIVVRPISHGAIQKYIIIIIIIIFWYFLWTLYIITCDESNQTQKGIVMEWESCEPHWILWDKGRRRVANSINEDWRWKLWILKPHMNVSKVYSILYDMLYFVVSSTIQMACGSQPARK